MYHLRHITYLGTSERTKSPVRTLETNARTRVYCANMLDSILVALRQHQERYASIPAYNSDLAAEVQERLSSFSTSSFEFVGLEI